MRRAVWCAVALAPLIAGCAAQPSHDRSEGFGTQTPGTAVAQPPPPVVVQPGQSVVVQPGQSVVVHPAPPAPVVVPGSQVVQVEDLEANEVRAQTIYANKIQAAEIRGTIHQTGEVKIDRSVADLKTPTVVASVLYADTIKANRVIADHIFVRNLERR